MKSRIELLLEQQEGKPLVLPEPQIMEIGMRVRFIVPLGEQIKIKAQVKKNGNQDTSRPELRPESQIESLLGSKLAIRVVLLLKESEAGKAQLAAKLGHKTVSGELKKQIKRLLELKLIEMTIPDKPNSRLQKYRLTEKGLERIAGSS
jgi:ATP-dependent DNA helicase RecG